MTMTSAHPIVEHLGAFGSIPDWLRAPMQPERVIASLRNHVPELSEPLHIRSLSCDRLRAKKAEWLARYTVNVVTPDGELEDIVLTGNLWGPDTDAPTAAPTRGARFGEPGWSCWLPDLRLALRVQASDDALPALRRLVDPTSVVELLQPVVRDAGYEDAAITGCDPVVVRYKPGSRCTVVVSVTYSGSGTAGPSPVVLKTHQGDKGESAWAAMNALWRRPEAWTGVVLLAEPLAYRAQDRILVQGPVPEDRTLKELAREAIRSRDDELLGQLRAALQRTARALAAVHGSGATYGRVATLDEEIAEVREVVDRLALSVPAIAPAAGPLLQRLTDRSVAVAPDPVVSAHHDFRPAQVLLHDQDVGFIDFDGACMAEPALDLGRFRAKLRDIGVSVIGERDDDRSGRHADETLTLLDELSEHFLDAYQLHADVSRERVLLWESCDLLTTMLHAWTKVRLARLEPRLLSMKHQLETSGLLSDA